MSDPLDFLFSLERFGMKFGLASMEAICDALGHPERAFASVHVAGTNGKGSVTAMLDAALRGAGYRVARYTSPHLVRVEERFVVDGREIDTAALRDAAGRIQRTVEDLVARGTLPHLPTFFECTTAIAFELFRSAAVEIAVLECGLGGRLDATNVVSPVVTAIVSIDLDHQAQLGETLASIAYEKAGILKRGVPVVCGPLPPEADAVVARRAAECEAPIVRPADDAALMARIAATPLALAGAHQVANAAVAVGVLDTLNAAGFHVPGAAIDEGLTRARWPGRIERFDHAGCPVIVDAAHNPAGARALAAYLAQHVPDGVTLVFGAMKDKAVDGMLAALAPLAREIVCTTAPTPRAMPAEVLAEAARRAHGRVSVEPDPFTALERACAGRVPVVVAGSIFLIGPLRERLARGILR